MKKLGGPNVFSAEKGTLAIGYSICVPCIKSKLASVGIHEYDDDLSFADYLMQKFGDEVPKVSETFYQNNRKRIATIYIYYTFGNCRC